MTYFCVTRCRPFALAIAVPRKMMKGLFQEERDKNGAAERGALTGAVFGKNVDKGFCASIE